MIACVAMATLRHFEQVGKCVSDPSRLHAEMKFFRNPRRIIQKTALFTRSHRKINYKWHAKEPAVLPQLARIYIHILVHCNF